MPPAYERMRDKFSKTMPLKDAKSKAARIFNSRRKKGVAPVTGGDRPKPPAIRRRMKTR